VRVYVKTPARLHLGLIDLGGELGRIFGGIGVAIEKPNVMVEAEPSETLKVLGEKTGEVRFLVKRFSEAYNTDDKVRVYVKRVLPEHVGLGSGTQLALAISTALAKLQNISASVSELSGVMGKGSVSGIGTAVFEHGGFVVEGGHKIQMDKRMVSASKSPPPVIFRQLFPEDWNFVVAIPNVKRGFTDQEEARAFEHLPSMPSEKVGSVCHLIVMGLLPALIERDIKVFGNSLTQIQSIVGDYFATVQGGRFSSSVAKDCIEYMRTLGAYGVGQSSWGPTVYGIVYGEEKAKRMALAVRNFLRKGVGGQVFHARANNKGAYVRVSG